MTAGSMADIFRDALFIAAMMVVVIVLPSLVIGLIVAMFQAATQINEQTLSFLPRLIAILMTLSFAGPWLGRVVLEFMEGLILQLPYLIG